MDAEEGPPLFSDVRLCGYLRKQKSQHRRYFVLRCASSSGPTRLECYESEKKFRAGGPGSRPKRAFPLASALSISKRADARHRHLLVLCGRGGTFGVAAENAEQQEAWHAALVELHCKGSWVKGAIIGKGSAAETKCGTANFRPNGIKWNIKKLPQSPKETGWKLRGKASQDGDGDSSALSGLAFKEVWQVGLRPRGLGHTKHLAGTYLLCLTDKTISFVKLNTDVAAVVLQLLNVRRCGHSENYFFMEVGRSAVTGPGELWMQVEDLVVAQNMHETILEAMKALSEEFRVRSKSQSPAPPREKGAGPRKPGSLSDYSALSSDEGGSSPGDSRPPNTPDRLSDLVAEGELDYIAMGKRALPEGRGVAGWGLGLEPYKRASLPPLALEKGSLPHRKRALKPVAASASYPEGLNRSADPSYMAMLPGVGRSAEGQAYIPMTPSSVSPPQESGGGYMLMSPSGSGSPDGPGQWGLGGGGSSSASDYMNMSPLSRSASSTPPEYSPRLAPPSAAPFYSLPRSYRRGGRPLSFPFPPGLLSSSSSTSSDSLEELAGAPCSACPPPRRLAGGRGTPATPRSSGEYISLEYGPRAPSSVRLELQGVPAEASEVAGPPGDGAAVPVTRLVQPDAPGRRRHGPEAFPEAEQNGVQPCEAGTEPGLNYIDLDLVKEAGAEAAPPLRAPAALPSQGGALHTYASIDFHRPWELRGRQPGPEPAELICKRHTPD
ncbi:UNVERIFIED_CONTAM: hypothetical protein K2H54_040716 [Gekko kuhli]